MAEQKDLKSMIINIIKDPDVSEETIADNTPLIGEEGLFFFFFYVLELIVEIEKKFGIKIKDNDIIQEHFTTFKSFHDFVNANEK